jgi:hypothetical protein
MRSIAACACLLLAGCFLENASSAKKLNDAVTEMNKATRWGQIGMAAQMVEPVYRQKFIANHSRWGELVQVADSEVVHVEIAPGDESAIAFVTYQWYEMEAMTLHESVVRQRWSRAGDGYALLSEVVIRGDGRLFASDDAKPAPMRDPLLGSAD